jgi:DNA-binding transcriptional ArsR family regulator
MEARNMPRKPTREIDWYDMPETEYRGSRLMRALGSPKNYALVKLLMKHGPLPVEEIAARLNRVPWDVSKMLRPLRDLDVVRFQKDGRYTLYTLKDPEGLGDLVRGAEAYARKAGAAGAREA